MSPSEKLQGEMAKLGARISLMDLNNCLERAGLKLIDGDTARRLEAYSWEKSPERMGR